MGKKKNLQEMLDNLSETELSNLEKLISGISNKSRNRKRGRGTRKKKKHTPPESANDSTPMEGLDLNSDELKEIQAASEFDKKMGFDQPKSNGIIPKAPTFQKVSVKCMVCGKASEVAPSLIPPEQSRFKCNACSCGSR